MSSPDARRAGLGALAALVLLSLSACGGSAEAESPAAATTTAHPAVAADDTTGRIAAVEFARQCAVTGQTFADESAITTDLDDRLAAAGLTHAAWKDWHDALADSPELLAQWTDIGAAGCPAT